ncbi:hypothetical protein HMPREF0578_2324, partial [Mobiluncus mulieris 28-1]
MVYRHPCPSRDYPNHTGVTHEWFIATPAPPGITRGALHAKRPS